MDHDLVTDDADAAVLDWETGLPPIKHEDLPRIIEQKIAAELIRLRFEMTALRQALSVAQPQVKPMAVISRVPTVLCPNRLLALGGHSASPWPCPLLTQSGRYSPGGSN